MIKAGKKSGKPFEKIKKRLGVADAAAGEKWIVLLCILSLFSSFDDMPLAALALIFMQLGTSRTTRYLCGGASVLYFAVTVTVTAFYIPYMAFVFIYLVADYLLENHRLKPVYPAVFTFAVTKWYMLSFGYEPAYWVLFALETAAVIVFPVCVTTGFELLRDCQDCRCSENVFEVMCTLALIAFALDGISVWGIQFSTAFLLAAACFYGTRDNLATSFAAVFVMMLGLCRHSNFALLCAGFGALYCSGLFFLSKGIKGYIGYIAASVIVAAMCASQFNSMVFISTAAVSAAVCFAASKRMTLKNTACDTQQENIGENEYIRLRHSLEKLNRAFRFLGHTVIDISGLVAKEFVPTALEDAAADEVCRRCKNNTLCWQDSYSDTQKQFTQYARALQNGGHPFFDGWFMQRCHKTEDLVHSFENHSRLISTQKLMHLQGQHNQRILQNQFLSMAAVLQHICSQSNRSGVANAAFTHKLDSFLSVMGKRADYCVCYQNPDRCIVCLREGFDGEESYKLRTKLENIYGTKFCLSAKENEGDSTVYIFSSVPAFSAEYGVRSTSRHSNCGDVWENFATEQYAFAVLADGMGTGSFACAEGKTASAMLKSLLTAGVEAETALEMTNVALNLKGTGQSCVAVDILQINLYDGSCSLYKAGAAPTLVFSGDKGEILYRDSLPIGVLKDTKIVRFSFALGNGDTVILASDGVEADKAAMTKISLAKDSRTPQQLADYIVQGQPAADDATAAVIKLIRR